MKGSFFKSYNTRYSFYIYFKKCFISLKIEHDYDEVLDSVYVWVCSLCKEKRIRFYNKPPTANQKGNICD